MMQRDYVYLLTMRVLTWDGGGGSTDTEKSRMSGSICVCRCSRSSESEGVDHAHYHYVPHGGDDGNPEPDGVTGHGLGLVRLAVGGGRRGGGVDAGRGVEERVLAAVVIVGGGVHEGPRHHGDLRSNQLHIIQSLKFQQNIH